jgi:ADP-heptose:LPS heptosyltransferase
MKDLSFRYRLLPFLLQRLLPDAGPVPHCRGGSVVCIRPGKLGDMFVATPLFSALKKHGNIGRCSVLCSPANEPVVRYNPFVDDCRVVNFHRTGEVIAAMGWMRRQRFDAVFDLTPGFSRTNLLLTLAAGRRAVRAGIEKGALAGWYHAHVGGSADHLADRFLAAGELLTGAAFPRDNGLEIYSSDADRDAAASFLRGIGGGGDVAVVNLSSATPLRQWPYDRFDTLLGLLATACPALRPALIGVGPQLEWAARLAQDHPGCIAVPPGPFLTIVEIIAGCRLFISTDTALMHAAAARRVPSVALYVGDDEAFRRWRPYYGSRGSRAATIIAPPGRGVGAIDPRAVCDEVVRVFGELNGPSTDGVSRA